MRLYPAKQRHFQCITSLSLLIAAAAYGQAQTTANPTSPHFDVATVRLSSPDARGTKFSESGATRFTVDRASLGALLYFAYGVREEQVEGMPKWAGSTYYDVDAVPPNGQTFNEQQEKGAMQQLLQERIHLSVHTASREIEGFRLVTANGGAKLQASKGGPRYRIFLDDDGLEAPNTTLSKFGPALWGLVGFPVVDETGLQGDFSIKLKFKKDSDENSSLPSIYTALEEQAGLKLERAKVPVEMIVIDHVDRQPTAN
jgi:uncharacterized protein (TIGR03435 family)